MVARAESSTETQQDGQKREHSGLRLIGIQQEKLKLRRTAMPLLGGYFPTKKILKALKVCLRGLLMGIAENLIGIWRAIPRFSTSLFRCHTPKLNLKEKQEGIRFVPLCLADASPTSICDLINSTHSLITNNSTCVSCGAMRSVPQTVTGAIMQQWTQLQLASLWSVTQLCLDLRGTDCHSFQVRHRYAKEHACGACTSFYRENIPPLLRSQPITLR